MKKWLMGTALIALMPINAFAGLYEDTDFVGTTTVPLNSLIISVFVLIGVFLVGRGIWGFKLSSVNPNQYPMLNQLMRIVSGAALLSSASIYHMAMNTFGANQSYSKNALSINEHDTVDNIGSLQSSWLGEYMPTQTIEIIMSMVFLFGVYSFLKGILILKDIGGTQPQGQDTSPLKKSLIHLVAGMIAMNIMDFSCFIGNTLGIPILCGN